jgi:hypothetical protein
MFANGASTRPAMRLLLIAFSLLGIVSTYTITGNPIDAHSVSQLTRLALETVVSGYGRHSIY